MVMRDLYIGSAALRERIPSSREPKDLDAFTPNARPGVDAFWHESFTEWIPEDTFRVATLDELYTIKVSHSSWELKNGSWEKHMNDIVLMQQNGAKLIPWLYDLLYKVWEQQHGKKAVDLNQDKTEFFSDAVRRKYDHDSIHETVAYGSRPMYESVMKDGESVATDMKKVKALSHEDKIKLYREEVYATALERWVIPSGYTVSPRLAYARALKKTITSLTKGWSSLFMIENYATFRTPDVDYVRVHVDRGHLLQELEN